MAGVGALIDSPSLMINPVLLMAMICVPLPIPSGIYNATLSTL